MDKNIWLMLNAKPFGKVQNVLLDRSLWKGSQSFFNFTLKYHKSEPNRWPLTFFSWIFNSFTVSDRFTCFNFSHFIFLPISSTMLIHTQSSLIYFWSSNWTFFFFPFNLQSLNCESLLELLCVHLRSGFSLLFLVLVLPCVLSYLTASRVQNA